MVLATYKQAYCCEMCVKSHQFLSKMANNRPLRTNWRAEMAANRSSWRRQAQPYFQPATHRGREIGLRSRLSVVRKARHVHRAWGEPGRFASPERKVRFGASADAMFANAAHTHWQAHPERCVADEDETFVSRIAEFALLTCSFSYHPDCGGRRNIHYHRNCGAPLHR